MNNHKSTSFIDMGRNILFVLLSVLLIGVGSASAQCTVSISGPSGAVCNGDNVTLTASTSASSSGNCAQSVNMTSSSGSTTVTCGSPVCFYDSGGPNGNYSASETRTHTFQSSTNSPLSISFLSVNVENNWDEVYVYAGTSATGTALNAGNEYNGLAGMTFTSNTGAITVKFTSDGSGQYAGWEAVVWCEVCSSSSYTYAWSNGMTGPTINVSPTSQTTYTVTASSDGCCTATASVTINPTNCVHSCSDFETAASRNEWTLVNGSAPNQWVMNTATNNGGQYSLYISNSPTSATPPNTYGNSSNSVVWAYKDFEFPECEEDFIFSFDWKGYGESSYDYMCVYIGPEAAVSAGTGSITAPTGYIQQFQNPTTGNTYFNLSSSWQHFETTLSNATYSGRVLRLYFAWRNDGSSGSAPPAAVDNVCIQSCVPCNQPVVNVTPASAVLCQGQSVTLNATVSGGSGHGYTYQWTPATGLSSTNTATTTATPNATTTYSLRVTDSEDCAKTVRIPVEVSGTTLSISQSPQVYCRGNDPVTLNAVLNVDGTCSNYTYAWSTGASGNVATDVPQQNTTYTVTATPVGGNCCTLTATHTVQVGDCNQDCSDFETADSRNEWTLVNGSAPNQWVMNTATSNGGQYSLYITNSPTSATPPNTYGNSSNSVVWAYKDFEFPECEEDFIFSFDWKGNGESSYDYMCVYIGPEAAVSAGTGSITAPTGYIQQFQNPTTGNSYFNLSSSWQHFETTLSNATYSGQYMRLYFVWRNDGSSGSAPPAAVDNVCIQACIPCDQPVVEVTPASVILCQGESATFTASASGGSGTGYTYTWSPESTLNTNTGPTVTASPQNTTVYRLRVVDSEGCAKTVRVTAEVSGTRLNVTANPPGFCVGQNQTVTVTAAIQAEGSCNSYTYMWSTGATSTSIAVSPDITTEYTVTATPTNPACCELISSAVVAVMDCSADGCPSVTPAELGTNNPEITLDCLTQQDVTLCANVLATAVEADDYFVFSIPYNPPYTFTDGNRIFANATDDHWSEVVNLPFTFCYYGNTYTQIVAGANSVATFNTSVANSYCAYAYDESIPDANLFPNTIFACYRDIYPSTSDYVASTGTGGIFEGVLGEYPCRSYKLSFNNIKLYSCTSVRTFSSMIVLYEGTNIIDIYLRDAPTCTSWNDGNGVIGLQNSDCTMGITPPGRNTGPWTAHEEAWRFMPTGQPSYHVSWYLGTDTSATTGIMLGTGDLLTVSPEETTFYTARLQYTACNGDYFDIINTCHVTVNNARPELIVTASQDTICPNQEVTITAVSDSVVHYEWNTGDTTDSFTLIPETYATTFICTTTYPNGCTRTDSTTVYAAAVIDPPTFIVEPEEICAGERSTISVELPYARYHWSNGSQNSSITVSPPQTTHYSLTVADAIGCPAEGETQVIVHPTPVASFMPEHYLTFLDDGAANVHFIDYSSDAENYLWDFGDPASADNNSTLTSPDHIYTAPGIYRIWLYVSTDFGCADSTVHEVSIQNPFYFYVPNSFSPDGDGLNEVWLPMGTGVKEDEYDCSVYDRWGRLVFHTNSLYQPWDGTDKGGKPLPVGSYVYSIRTFTMDLIPKEFLGTVTIIK